MKPGGGMIYDDGGIACDGEGITIRRRRVRPTITPDDPATVERIITEHLRAEALTH